MSVATKVAKQQAVSLNIKNNDGELTVTPSIAAPDLIRGSEGRPENAIKKERPPYPVKKLGGTYFYSAGIFANKNVFVTPEYLDVMANAFRTAELNHDIKNLAYVVMPNHFMWIFKLSDTKDDPTPVYRDLKKQVSIAVLNMLKEEAKVPEQQLPLFELFKDNAKVTRSNPRKILWTFKEAAKQMELKEGQKPQKHRVWDMKSRLYLLDNEHRVKYNLKFLADAPMRERWQLVTSALSYPYLYVHDDLIPQLSAD